jgi:hypothetical protein
VEPAAKFDPIPAGKYLAVITESEQKPTKAGTGPHCGSAAIRWLRPSEITPHSANSRNVMQR